jgi:hypothetical protein
VLQGATNWYESDNNGNPIGDPFETDYDAPVCSEYDTGGGAGGGAGGTGAAGEGQSGKNDVYTCSALNVAKPTNYFCGYACYHNSSVVASPNMFLATWLMPQIRAACPAVTSGMGCPTGLRATFTVIPLPYPAKNIGLGEIVPDSCTYGRVQ